MTMNVYGHSGKHHHHDRQCCTASTGCKTPECYDPDKIVAECIFVEKVYDSAIIKDERDEVESFTISRKDLGFFVPMNAEVKNLCVTCTTKPVGESCGVTVTPTILTINGMVPPVGPTPTGPGGVEQIDLSFIDTTECDMKGKGTPIIVDQEICVSGEVLVTISGTVVFPDGRFGKHSSCEGFVPCDGDDDCDWDDDYDWDDDSDYDHDHHHGRRRRRRRRSFCISCVIDFDDYVLRKFVKLCIPSTFAALKPSLAEFCAISCDFRLPLGVNSIVPDGKGGLCVNGILVLCLICEKKCKVPVQLCVLSTGFCDQPEQRGLCTEFPKLFPDQVNVEIIE